MDTLILSESSLLELATKIESLPDEQRMQISRFIESLEDQNERPRLCDMTA